MGNGMAQFMGKGMVKLNASEALCLEPCAAMKHIEHCLVVIKMQFILLLPVNTSSLH